MALCEAPLTATAVRTRCVLQRGHSGVHEFFSYPEDAVDRTMAVAKTLTPEGRARLRAWVEANWPDPDAAVVLPREQLALDLLTCLDALAAVEAERDALKARMATHEGSRTPGGPVQSAMGCVTRLGGSAEARRG